MSPNPPDDAVTVAIALPATSTVEPVFLDTTGRRRRTLRGLAIAACAATALYLGLLAVSVAGGPASPGSLIPFAGGERAHSKPAARHAPKAAAGTKRSTGGARPGRRVGKPVRRPARTGKSAPAVIPSAGTASPAPTRSSARNLKLTPGKRKQAARNLLIPGRPKAPILGG